MKTNKIKYPVILGVCLMLISLISPAWGEDTWQQVEKEINKEKSRAEQDAALTERLVSMDRSEMQKEVEKLRDENKNFEIRHKALVKQYEDLVALQAKMETELAGEQQDVEEVEGTLRSGAKQAESMVRDNPITSEIPERINIIGRLRDPDKVPGLEGIKELVDVYFGELKATRTITKRTGQFVATDGTNATGDILRAGMFTTYFRKKDGEVGFLKPESDGIRLIGVPGDVPRSALNAISDYFNGKSNTLPIDPSRGGAFASYTKKTELVDKLEEGGSIMYVIAAVGILAILIIIERFIILFRIRSNTDDITARITGLAENGEWEQASIACKENGRVPTCRMLQGALGHVGASQEVLENTLQEGILRETPHLERFLPTLGVLATIAPLLGLLGTVTGMINTFKVITAQGTGDANAMAGGISEALLTTEFGLVVAIPLILLHHMLSRRVDKIVGDMEEKGTAFAVTMTMSGAVTSSEV
jgi:biopolymer transport protein ExbB